MKKGATNLAGVFLGVGKGNGFDCEELAVLEINPEIDLAKAALCDEVAALPHDVERFGGVELRRRTLHFVHPRL